MNKLLKQTFGIDVRQKMYKKIYWMKTQTIVRKTTAKLKVLKLYKNLIKFY